jgi:lipoprotein NlpI
LAGSTGAAVRSFHALALVSVLAVALAWPSPSVTADGASDCAAPSCILRVQDAAPGQGNVTPQQRAFGLLGRAHAFAAAGNGDRAIADLDEAIRLDPTLADAFIGRGTLLHQRGDETWALADLNEAVRLAPASAVAHSMLGDILQAQRNSDGAIAEYDTAIGLDPRLADAYLGRGVATATKGDNLRAIADYTTANALAGPNAAALHNRGVSYSAVGDLDRAVADFTAAIAAAPVSARTYFNRGFIYARRGDLAAAITDFTSAIRFDSEAADAYLLRGIASLYAADEATALKDINLAAQLAPNQAVAALWVTIVSGRKSQLTAFAARAGTVAWPGPVVSLFLGQTTLEALLADADTQADRARARQVCQANFYAAELKLLEDAPQEAAPLLERAARDCPPTFLEWFAANAELKGLRPGGTTVR